MIGQDPAPVTDRLAIAVGVLLDTLIVRTILVPALVRDVGRRVR